MTDLFGFQGLFNAQYSNSSQQQVYANQAMAQSQMQAMMNNAYATQSLAQSMAYRNNQFQSQGLRSTDGVTWMGGYSVPNPSMAVRMDPQSPNVAATAASRVDKPDWEKRADQKEAELNDWLRSIGLGHIADMDFSDAGSE